MAGENNVVLVPDTIDADSAIAEPIEESTASLASSILQYHQENGRTYHALSRGKYVLPNDEQEQERLDLTHHLWLLTFDDSLALCPKKDGAKKVLDVGTGTGIWAVDYADEHPEAEVVGVDLSPIQPSFIPPNCGFEVDDAEKMWTWTKLFDFIFVRSMIGSFDDWQVFFEKAYQNLEPGGYLEVQDHFFPIHCDDDTLDGTAVLKWSELLVKAMREAQRPITVAPQFKKMMQAAGFEDVVEVQRKVPTNPWAKDRRHKALGRWSLASSNMVLEAMTLAPFSRFLHWSQDETLLLCSQVRSDMKNPAIHAYWPVYGVYGRKPE